MPSAQSAPPTATGSLRSHLLRPLLAVMILPVLVVSVITGRTSYLGYLGSTEQLLTARAAAVQQQVDGYLDMHTRAIAALARSVPADSALKSDAWRQPVHNYFNLYRGFLTLAVIEANGRVFLAVDPSGRLRVNGLPETDVKDRQYFQRALTRDSVYVSDAILGRGLGKDPIVAISRAFAGSSGRTAGVVEGSLDLKQLGTFAKQYEASGSGGVVIADGRGRVTYASATLPFRVLDNLSASPLLVSARGHLFRYSYPGSATGDSRDYVGGSSERSRYDWRVFVLEPSSVLNQIVSDRVWSGLAALLFGAAISFLLASIVARSITRPLEHLAIRVRKLLADGMATPDADAGAGQRAWDRAPSELAKLSTGFEFMASRLRESYGELQKANDELESRVRERTIDLERTNLELKEAIEQQCRTENELRLFQRAMAATSEGVTIVDATRPELPLVYVNSGFERLTGYAASEVLGRNPHFLIDSQTDLEISRGMIEAIQRLEPCTVEVLTRRKDASRFWTRLSLTPVDNGQGVVTHYVGIQVDVTQHKELERLKNDLVSTVSHELRTPLTSLQGFAELMLKRNFAPERNRQFLHIIHKESTRLTQLINDFLDIQRVESGRQNFLFEVFAFRPLLDEAVQMVSNATSQHRFSVALDDPDLQLYGDQQRIRQVLDNLLSNARKFSPNGGTIEVKAKRAETRFIISVHDEGIGIPADALPKLFTRFYRVDNSETRKIGGTGLGLELAKKIIESHGGEMWVESTPGEGSTFFFSVPAADALQSQSEEREPVAGWGIL